MSPKEARRLAIMEHVLTGKVTIAQAALVLDLSKRQVKRLKGGMLKEGTAFLAHKSRGKKPKHALSQQCRDEIISHVLNDYRDASCEQMAELLMQYQGISVSSRAIRRMLVEASIPNTHSHKVARRRLQWATLFTHSITLSRRDCHRIFFACSRIYFRGCRLFAKSFFNLTSNLIIQQTVRVVRPCPREASACSPAAERNMACSTG